MARSTPAVTRPVVALVVTSILLQAVSLGTAIGVDPRDDAAIPPAVVVADPAGASDDVVAPGVAAADEDAPPAAGTVTARDANSTTVSNGDGTLSSTFSVRPQAWQDPTGAWRDFDNALVDADGSIEGAAVSNRAGPFAATFAAAADVAAGRPISNMADGEIALTTTAVSASPTALRRDQTSLTYTDAWPGADLRYTLDNERVKEDIVLQRPPVEAPAFAFTIALQSLRAERQGGGLVFRDADGLARFAMPPLSMVDNAAQPASARVPFELALRPDGVTLTVLPDLEWLSDPDRVYPVSIDPSTVFIGVQPEDDHANNVGVVQATPTTNFYGASTMTVAKSGAGSRSDALISFPSLDGFPADSVVTSAELVLEMPSGTTGMGLEVLRNTAGFEDSSVTWNTAPPFDATPVATANAVVGGQTHVALTELIGQWIAGSVDNFGVRLRSTGSNGQSVAVHSSWATCGGCQPELEITYVPATRYGFNPLWTRTTSAYGGGTSAGVEISSGNLALSHAGGAIDARGFSVELTHTFNSADTIGLATGGGAGVYGKGWSFAWNLRLFDVDGDEGVIFKDGSGDESRVFVNDGVAGGVRSYRAPPHYGFTLIEDVSSPPADKVWTLTSDVGNVEHFFDAEGKLTRVEDRNANFLDFTYDGSDRLTEITDVAGRDTTLDYGLAGGRLTDITDMAGRVHSYGYNGSGDLTTITHADGSPDEVTTTFAYDDAHRLISITNPRGHTANIAYTAFNRWETAGDEEGWQVSNGDPTLTQSATRAHAGSGSLQVGLTAVGDTVESVEREYATPQALSAIAHELVAWVFRPSGSTGLQARLVVQYADHLQTSGDWQTLTANAWQEVRLPAAQLEARGQVRELELHFRRQSGQPAYTGDVWVDDVALQGQVASQSDAKPTPNTVVTYAYDPENAESEVSRPNSAGTFQATTYAYDRMGAVDEVTNPLGHTTGYPRDELLRVFEITPPGVGAGTYTLGYYPNSMQLQTASNGTDEIYRRGADTATGDTTYSLDPLNEERRGTGTTAYDATVLVRDATGNVLSARQSNFVAGTDLETADPTSGSEHRQADFTYTTGGLLDTMTDPEGNVTDFDYDVIATGYLTDITTEAGSGEGSDRVTSIVRNADGSADTLTDPKGQLTSFEYDDLGRLTDITYDDGGAGEFTVSYTLDDNGNLTAMSDAAGSSTFTYDENNRLTAESRTQNSTTKSAAYAYFGNGTMQTLTTFASQTVTFAYDNALRLTSQTDPKNGGGSISFGYDNRDRRTTITYPSGIKHTQTFDPGGRIASIVLETSGGTDRQSFTYGYGLNGSGQQTASYRGGNVISVTELSGATVTYGYDALLRLTRAVRTVNNTLNHTYAYDDANNRTSFNSTSYTYDNANQMIGAGALSLTYDRNGSVTGYTGGNTYSYNAANQWTGASINGTTYAYTYDGLGRQVSRSQGGTRTDFWFDATGMTLETGGSAKTYLRDPSGLPLSVHTGSTLSNFGRDRLGTITGLTSTAQTLSGTVTYDPWGRPEATSGNAADSNLRFTAARRDPGTGYHHMGVRTYQYAWARFTTVDPLPASITDINRYAYAACNPANRIDPTGLIDIGYCANSALSVSLLGVGRIGGSVAGVVSNELYSPFGLLLGKPDGVLIAATVLGLVAAPFILVSGVVGTVAAGVTVGLGLGAGLYAGVRCFTG